MSTLSCAFGLHRYEVYKEFDFTDVRDNVLGKVIVSRCSCCGKIKRTRISTVGNNNIYE